MTRSPLDMSLLRRSYHRVVPGGTRKSVNRFIDAARRRRANLRWRMLSPDGRRRWVEQRLNLPQSAWLFVLTLNNSGSTLLQHLLGLHPNVRDSHKEGRGMTEALPRSLQHNVGRQFTRRLDVFRWTEDNDPSPALRCMFDWAHFFPPGSGYLLEKTPENVLRSRWLQANFQPCRFIAMIRHPAAVCEGIVRRRPDLTIEDAARHWTVAHDVLREDMPHLDNVYWFTYEQLCRDPLNVVRQLERFLELPVPFDRRLVGHKFQIHNMDDQPAVIQNYNERSFARLSDDDWATILRIAGPTMATYGYEPRVESGSSPR